MGEQQDRSQDQLQKLRLADQIWAKVSGKRLEARQQRREEQKSPSGTEDSSGRHRVRDEDSWEVFGLCMSAMLADVGAVRAGPSAEIPGEISPKLVRALLHLMRHRSAPLTVGSLAEGLGVSLGWASRLVDELVLNGFLNRIRRDRDRRVVHLELTQRAVETGDRLWNDREAAFVAALDEVSPSERQAIGRFLRRLTAELELRAPKANSH